MRVGHGCCLSLCLFCAAETEDSGPWSGDVIDRHCPKAPDVQIECCGSDQRSAAGSRNAQGDEVQGRKPERIFGWSCTELCSFDFLSDGW